MLQYEKIDVSEGIDVNKTSASKECELCHYWFFKDGTYFRNTYPGINEKWYKNSWKDLFIYKILMQTFMHQIIMM